MATGHTLDALNAATAIAFIGAQGAIFENAPWVAEHAAAARPFATVEAPHAAMLTAVRTASPECVTSFLRGHPELAGAAAIAVTIGADSTAEQSVLELQRPACDSAAYRGRFGFPFILCIRRHTRSSVLAEFHPRLKLDPSA